MVHRDIKPGNILISRQGQVKLTDFGVTETISCCCWGKHVRRYGEIHVTRAVEGQVVRVSADVWALGICLMELATGEHPYSKYKCASQMEVLLALENEPLPELPASMLVRISATSRGDA